MPPVPGSPRDTLGGVRKAALCRGLPGPGHMGDELTPPAVCGVCVWVRAESPPGTGNGLFYGPGWRLGGPFLSLEGR